jgi:hypothetical protein
MTDQPDDPNREARTLRLAENILAMIADAPQIEAQTALAIAITAAICADQDDAAGRQQAAESFTRKVRECIARQDIVGWIMASPVWAAPKQ